MLKDVNMLSAEECALLDKAAKLVMAGDEQICGLYEKSPGLKASGTIKSYIQDCVTEFVI